MNLLSGRTVEGRKTVTVLFCDLVAALPAPYTGPAQP
jgi:hypothetical protein